MTSPAPPWSIVFGKVANQEVDRGVIPIENSLFGSVHVNYDLLLGHTVRIVGELMLRVRHCLMAAQGTTIANMRVLITPTGAGAVSAIS